MDLNQSMEFPPSALPAQVHNFMPMPMPMPMPPHMLARYHQTCHEDGGEVRYSRIMQLQRQTLDQFWGQRMLEIHNISEFKSHHQLPLARIKRIMKSDEKVKMISADTPVLFAKACEVFILELSIRAWLFTEDSRRRTLQRGDIARAIRHDDVLDFLMDLVPTDDPYKEVEIGRNSVGPEPRSANQLHFPIMDLNGEFAMANQGIPQQFMFQPSMSSAQLNYQSGPK